MGQTADAGTELTLVRDPKVLTISSMSFVTMFGSQAVSPALPSIAAAFGVSDAGIGLVMTLYTLPGIFVLPVFGVVADVYGRRVVLLPAFFLMCLFGMAIVLADSFGAILALRLACGLAYAGIMALLATMLGDLYTGSTGSTAQGLRFSANGICMIVIPALAGYLAGIAWNYPFALYAAGFPILAAAYLTLPETVSGSESRGFRTELREYVRSLRSVAADRSVLVLVVGGLFRGAGLFALLTFLPLFAARDLGATAFTIGVVLAGRGVVRILVAPFTGRILAVLSRRQSLLGGLAIVVVGVVLVAASQSVVWLGLAFCLFSLGDSVFIPIHRDSVAALTTDESRAGVLSGVSLLRKVGSTLSPVVFGIALGVVGFEALFLLVAALFGSYAVAILALFAPS